MTRAVFALVAVLANLLPLAGAPAHPHPYLMPPVEKERLLERLRSSEKARKQFEMMKEQRGEVD